MIEYLILENGPNSITLNTDDYPFVSFTTDVDIRRNERTKPTEHGLWNARVYFGKRVFHIEGDILGDTAAEYITFRKALVSVLMPHNRRITKNIGTLRVRFSDMTEEMTCDFTIDGYPEMPLEALAPARSKFLINLVTPDPRLYGTTLRTVSLVPSITGVQGRTYNKTFNKTYSAAAGPDTIVAINSGNIETFPTAVITGPVTGPRIIIDNSSTVGKRTVVQLPNLVLGSTDVLTLDYKNRTAVMANGQNMYSFVQSSEWGVLEPGNNLVNLAAAIFGSGSSAVINHYSAYMV